MATADNSKPADQTTVMALANCAAIAVGIVRSISGTSISKTINNSPLTQEAVANQALTRIVSNLISRSGRASTAQRI